MKVTIKRHPNPSKVISRRISGIRTLIDVLYLAPLKHQRAIDLSNAKLAKYEQDMRVAEIALQERHNKLVMQDIEIEKKKLELYALQLKLGKTETEFAAELTERI